MDCRILILMLLGTREILGQIHSVSDCADIPGINKDIVIPWNYTATGTLLAIEWIGNAGSDFNILIYTGTYFYGPGYDATKVEHVQNGEAWLKVNNFQTSDAFEYKVIVSAHDILSDQLTISHTDESVLDDIQFFCGNKLLGPSDIIPGDCSIFRVEIPTSWLYNFRITFDNGHVDGPIIKERVACPGNICNFNGENPGGHEVSIEVQLTLCSGYLYKSFRIGYGVFKVPDCADIPGINKDIVIPWNYTATGTLLDITWIGNRGSDFNILLYTGTYFYGPGYDATKVEHVQNGEAWLKVKNFQTSDAFDYTVTVTAGDILSDQVTISTTDQSALNDIKLSCDGTPLGPSDVIQEGCSVFAVEISTTWVYNFIVSYDNGHVDGPVHKARAHCPNNICSFNGERQGSPNVTIEANLTLCNGQLRKTLIILYGVAPGTPVVAGAPSYPVIESDTLSGITCTLPSGEEGFPDNGYLYILTNTESSLMINSTNGQLTIDPLNITLHDGTWECRVRNAAGTGPPGLFSLMVYAAPVIQRDPPPAVSLTINETLSAACSFRGRPEVTITWTYNSNTLPAGIQSDSSTSPSGKYTVTTSNLSWSQATYTERKAASGLYRCVANNTAGSETTTQMNLTVLYAPGRAAATDASIEQVFEETTVVLECSVSDPGSPRWHQFRWMKDASFVDITTTGTYTIVSLTVADHDGIWTCTAVNTIGQGHPANINLNVYALPVLQSPFPTLTIPVAENITSLNILCSVQGRPPPAVMWDNNNLPPGVISVEEPDTTAGKLTTVNRRLRWADDSTLEQRRLTGRNYTCGGTILANIVEGIVAVDVKYDPFNVAISPTGNYTSLENETVTLICEAKCNPSCHYTWMLGDSPIQTGEELHFDSIQKSDEGWYICTASNGRGQDKQHHTYISVHYPPSRPTGFQAVRVTAVSITVEWMTGFDGGLPQTFTITYTNIDSGDEEEMSDIPDECPPEGCIMERKITEGIADDVNFELQVITDNGKAIVEGNIIATSTPERASFEVEPQIILKKNEADVTFMVKGQLTHILISHCISQTDTCQIDEFQFMDAVDNKDTVGRVLEDDIIRNFKELVMLVDQTASSFQFWISFYDEDDEINVSSIFTEDRVYETNIGGIIGGVMGGLVLAALVVMIVLWRKGIIFQKVKKDQHHERQDERHYENMGLAPVYNEIPVDMIEKSTYEDFNDSKRTIMNESTGYASMPQPSVHIIEESCSTVVEVISETNIYRVALANTEVAHQIKLPKKLVSKLIKDSNQYPVHQNYLEGAVEATMKLVNCDNVINCLGLASARRELLLEHVDFGSLRQYLTRVTDATYINASRDHSRDLVHFIHQAANGVTAVAELEPEALFYCLSLDHVLLGMNFTIKLTGFSLAECVKAREVTEDEIGLPRPLRWLAPEAIDLMHCSQSDVWSFGILMWEIMNQGQIPFSEIPNMSIMSHIKKGCLLEKPDICSNDMYDLMQECWRMNYENRPAMSKVKSHLMESSVYQNILFLYLHSNLNVS